jgi:pilus assembly protein Flp/PilA
LFAVRKALRRSLTDDGGATAIEYGLIAAMIAVAAIGGMTALGGGSAGMWGRIKDMVLASM